MDGSTQDPPVTGGPTENGPDLARMLAVAETEQRRTSERLRPDDSLIYGVWGAAWFVGPGLMWLALRRDALPENAAGAVFAALLVAAGVVTGVHSARRGSGVVGRSSRIGAMYGWAWFLGFVSVGVVANAAHRAGASDDVVRILWTALSCLVVGLLYLAGGALWEDRTMFAIGVWVLATGSVGSLFGSPDNLAVMSLAGGGGFLVAAALARLRRAR